MHGFATVTVIGPRGRPRLLIVSFCCCFGSGLLDLVLVRVLVVVVVVVGLVCDSNKSIINGD